MAIIAPSILAADFSNLKLEIEKLNSSNAEWIHFDVMDGHFVPNLTFGPDIFKVFKNNSTLFLDVHIMVSNPFFISKLFVDAGADQIVFHFESLSSHEQINKLITYLKNSNVKVGISIKLDTNVECLVPYLDQLDNVLIMAVEPGFGGQKFQISSLDKIKYLNEYRKCNNLNFLLQIDGGIDNTNKDDCYKVGCDCLVSGSYLFNNDNFSLAVDSLL